VQAEQDLHDALSEGDSWLDGLVVDVHLVHPFLEEGHAVVLDEFVADVDLLYASIYISEVF